MKKRTAKKVLSKYQILRLLSLTLFFLLFIFIPISNWYSNQKIAYNNPRLVGLASGEFYKVIYSILDNFYSLWDDPVTAAASTNGSIWAFTILGIPLSDPLGLISEMINAVHFPIKYFLGGLIPFFLALLFGRFFCSWLCPMYLIFSWTQKLRVILEKFSIPTLALKIDQSARVYIFFIGMLLSYIWGAWVWHFVLPYITFSHEIFSLIVFSSFTFGIYFFVAIIVLDLGLIPGAYCDSLCPTGFLLSFIGKISIFKLKAKEKDCPTKCTLCKKVCPIDLFPKTDHLYSCHLCMKCVDICPKDHIRLSPRFSIFEASK